MPHPAVAARLQPLVEDGGVATCAIIDLARRGQHRRAIPDLIIAAAAESAGLTVLHHDADDELIAAVTGQPHQWIVPRGLL